MKPKLLTTVLHLDLDAALSTYLEGEEENAQDDDAQEERGMLSLVIETIKRLDDGQDVLDDLPIEVDDWEDTPWTKAQLRASLKAIAADALEKL